MRVVIDYPLYFFLVNGISIIYYLYDKRAHLISCKSVKTYTIRNNFVRGDVMVYDKEKFLEEMTKMSKEDLNKIIAENGKRKMIRPFTHKPLNNNNSNGGNSNEQSK